MTNIVIDYGNTRIKAGLFNDSRLVQKEVFTEKNKLKTFLTKHPHDNLLVSTVKEEPSVIFKLSACKGKKIALTAQLPLPVKIKYKTPQTLGVDRIAAACGALQLFPGEDCLVIDTGTCVNYELIDRQGAYQGGIISPGVRMRFEAMHTLTARLPLTKAVLSPTLIGKDTAGCMQSGVMNGLMNEIKGIIKELNQKYPALRVILCGGDAGFFENQLKPSIFVAPDLVLTGLNRILTHNVG